MFRRKTGRETMDMCSGPLTGKILRFALPLILTGVLQLLYNAADIVVVGQFSGKEALAAVGATSALINLIVNLFMGLSVGASVAVARAWGAKDEKGVHQAVHTAVLVAGVCGLFLMGIGISFARIFLIWMGTPDDVIEGATLYMQIYFAGMPFNLLYNFCAAILRGSGDSKRPLYILTFSGLINVGLNLDVCAWVWHVGGGRGPGHHCLPGSIRFPGVPAADACEFRHPAGSAEIED